jgi:hypothetical protein
MTLSRTPQLRERPLISGCLGALWTLGLIYVAVHLVGYCAPGPLRHDYLKGSYLPVGWKVDLVKWLFTAYLWEAVIISAAAGIVTYRRLSRLIGVRIGRRP